MDEALEQADRHDNGATDNKNNQYGKTQRILGPYKQFMTASE